MKYKLFTIISLLIISSLIVSCSDKEPWGISEPQIAINPTFKKLTNKELSKSTEVNFKKYTIEYKNKVALSELKSAKLSLYSEIHFSPKDFGLTLKVNSSCFYSNIANNKVTKHSWKNPGTKTAKFTVKNVIENSIDIQIQKNIAFLSLIPKKLLNLIPENLSTRNILPILTQSIICDFDFSTKNSNADEHSFKLRKVSFFSQEKTKQGVSNSSANIKIFLQSELTDEDSQYKSKLNQKVKILNEEDLAFIYFENLEATTQIELYCMSNTLNFKVDLSVTKIEKFYLSFFEVHKSNHHDVAKTSFCRIIQYDQFNNIKKLSPLFSINLENITKTPPPPRKKHIPTDDCDPMHTLYDYNRCGTFL